MPRSDDAERGVLSAFLQNPQACIGRFHEIGCLDWFYHVGNRLLAEEMFLLLEEKGALDVVMLSQWLIDRDLIGKIGGPATLAELLNFVPTPAHFRYYAEILAEKHILRQALLKLQQAQEDLYTFEDSLKEKGDVILGHLAAVEALFREQDKTLTLAEQLVQWQEDWNSKLKHEKTSAMPTRWPILNLRMGGLNDGYTLIGGEYSSGKSVLMRNLLVDACILKHSRPGFLANYETSVSDTISGMICDIGGIPSEMVFRPDCSPPLPAHTKSIAWAIEKISNSKLKIIHEPHLSAEGLVSKARAMRDKEGDLVVAVDYLQKIPRPAWIEKQAPHERELAANSDTIQKLSKECPVLMACQLNKEGETRGSTSIAMDADISLRIDGAKGIFVQKHKSGARFYHLPLYLEANKLRFIEGEPNAPFP
jgi:replicative DNA helicase